jgi:hypothetical protein
VVVLADRPTEDWEWLFLLIWPVLVLASEEARTAVLRQRAPDGDEGRG